MPTFRKAGRSLFLLALFHLAGGPVVLCGVFLLAKMVGSQALHLAEQRLPRSSAEVSPMTDSPSFHALLGAVHDALPDEAQALGSATGPSKPALPKSRKNSDAKGKFIGFAEAEAAPSAPVPPAALWAIAEPLGMRSHGGLPPPLPPPRWA